MCHGKTVHGRRASRRSAGRGWYSRELVLERLESYQRDLEQELVDVSELLERLRDGAPQPTPS